LIQQEYRQQKKDSLENRYGTAVDNLQKEFPCTQTWKRFRFLRLINRFDGDLNHVENFLKKLQQRQENPDENHSTTRRERREELKTKYASQLAELELAGISSQRPGIFRQLEKHQGDVNKVLETMKKRSEKKDQKDDLNSKYSNELTQCENDGIQLKNKRVLLRLLEKSNGDVEQVKKLIEERQEKCRQRKDYRRKHRDHSKTTAAEPMDDGNSTEKKKRRELSSDDVENLKRLRAAGVHGNPQRILEIFHECNESIEMTIARKEEQREQRLRQREEREKKRTLLKDVHNSYLSLDKRDDWPTDIEQVYLDGNNMMFVVDSLRRLCLNRAGKKTERALGEIAAAWNDQLGIPNVDLVFDSTNQTGQIGSVMVSSAQPQFRTTDDMLVEIARRPENREKNKRTIIVTSDRALAALLQNEGCQLIKPYSWFAHCVMILTPDLIKHEEMTGLISDKATSTTVKKRYNFDELVHRVAKIDIA